MPEDDKKRENDEPDETETEVEADAAELAKALLGQQQQMEKVRIPDTLPVLPVRNMTLFPEMIAPIVVGREASKKLVDDVLLQKKLLGITAAKDDKIQQPKAEDIFLHGTVARIVRMLKFPDGNYRLFIQGLKRFHIEEFVRHDPYLIAKIKVFEDTYDSEDINVQGLTRNITNLFQRIAGLIPNFPEEMRVAVANITQPYSLIYVIAANINMPKEQKQKFLEDIPLKEKLEILTVALNKELEVLEVGSKIQEQVESEVSKKSREMYLRQQLKAIQEELGAGDDHVRLDRNAPGDLGAKQDKPFLGLGARHGLKRAGKNECLSGKGPFPFRLFPGDLYPEFNELVDQAFVFRVVEETPDRLGHDRADVRDGGQFLDPGLPDGLKGTKGVGQDARRGFADVANTKGVYK